MGGPTQRRRPDYTGAASRELALRAALLLSLDRWRLGSCDNPDVRLSSLWRPSYPQWPRVGRAGRPTKRRAGQEAEQLFCGGERLCSGGPTSGHLKTEIDCSSII